MSGSVLHARGGGGVVGARVIGSDGPGLHPAIARAGVLRTGAGAGSGPGPDAGPHRATVPLHVPSRTLMPEVMPVPQEIYPVPPRLRERSHVRSMEQYQAMYRRSLDDPSGFWAEQAGALDWFHPWHQVFDADYEQVDFGWYLGGRLNACFNCVDRHVALHGE